MAVRLFFFDNFSHENIE
jgi:hypothetical protein